MACVFCCKRSGVEWSGVSGAAVLGPRPLVPIYVCQTHRYRYRYSLTNLTDTHSISKPLIVAVRGPIADHFGWSGVASVWVIFKSIDAIDILLL